MKKSNHKDDDKRAIIFKGEQDMLHVKSDPPIRLKKIRGRNKFNIRRWPKNFSFIEDVNFKVFQPRKTLNVKSKSGSHSLPELHHFKTGYKNKL
jgi:hypothetical protein